MDIASRYKTAFSSRYGHYHWNILPFGLSNMPGAFQRRMNKVLALFIDKFVIVNLDDILIYSKTIDEHKEHVKMVLKALHDVDMILNLNKCKFYQTEVKFLGHIISTEGSRPDPQNIQKVIDWPTPHTITDVRGFNNLAGHYRRYIDGFAKAALPLRTFKRVPPRKERQLRGRRGRKRRSKHSNVQLRRNRSSDTPKSANLLLSIPIPHNTSSARSCNSSLQTPTARN